MEFLRQSEQKSSKTRRSHALPAGLQDSHGSLSGLQRSAGNQAIQSLFRSGSLQAKLSVVSIDDPAEREAEATATHVMDSSATSETRNQSSPAADIIQRFP